MFDLHELGPISKERLPDRANKRFMAMGFNALIKDGWRLLVLASLHELHRVKPVEVRKAA
jgi:hypothetical protein